MGFPSSKKSCPGAISCKFKNGMCDIFGRFHHRVYLSLLVCCTLIPPPFPSFSLWRQKSSRNKREPNPISMSLFLALFWLLSGEQKDLNLVAPFFILRTVEAERGEGWETADAPRVTPHRGEGFHNVKSHFFPSFLLTSALLP